MSDESWAEIEEVFAEAAALEPAGRAALLDDRCAGRPELRREVEALLASHDNLGTFLQVVTVVPLTPVADRATRAQVGDRVGHYRLVEQVAAGNMGDVFRAEDLALGRDAAVKLLPKALGSEIRETVLVEVEASARLQHPAIATFYEAGDADGETFIAMEFVRGPTLRERLKDGPVPFGEALSITRCLLEALAHAHASGLVHRDIKPENVVLVEPTFAKLLDFGIAVPLSAGVDAPRAGTIGYLAPEQAAGGPLDARTDVFQVGVVLYEMLTGQPAFQGGTPLERFEAAMAGATELTSLDEVRMPAAISGIVRRALAREPQARYDSAAAFLRDLRGLDGGLPSASMPSVVAVTDFENRSDNASLDWLESALAESIRSDLAGLTNVTVIPQQRLVTALAEPGASEPADPVAASLRLGCGWLVRGELDASRGTELRIVARLVEVATGRVQATHEVLGGLESLFDLQRSLARALSSELSGVAVSAGAGSIRSTAIEAHEYFTRARLLIEGFGKGSLEDARHLLEQAIAVDERHVGALAALTTTHGLRAIASPNAADYESAIAYADRALAIDPRHVSSWVWRAYALSALGRHAEAETSVGNALDIDPYDTEALYFAAGVQLFWREPPHVREALVLLRRAVERDDSRGMWWLALGTAHACVGNDREALYSFTRALRLESTPSRFNTAGAAAYTGETLRRMHRLEEARTAAFDGLEATERSDHAYRDTFRAHALTVIGRIALDQRNAGAAEAAFQQVLAQARGRPQPRACGHFVVQALCGLARATEQPSLLDEARRLFESRDTFNFAPFYGALDADALIELAHAAGALGRHDDANGWLALARDAGAAGRLALGPS